MHGGNSLLPLGQACFKTDARPGVIDPPWALLILESPWQELYQYGPYELWGFMSFTHMSFTCMFCLYIILPA